MCVGVYMCVDSYSLGPLVVEWFIFMAVTRTEKNTQLRHEVHKNSTCKFYHNKEVNLIAEGDRMQAGSVEREQKLGV